MKNAKLQFDQYMSEYVKYAAMIKRTTPEKLIGTLRRTFNRITPVRKRDTDSLRRFVEMNAVGAVEHFEWKFYLPKSTTYSRRKDALNRAWMNMIGNRAALASGAIV